MDEVIAELCAPGQLFEMDELDIRGIPTRVWKHAPPTLGDVLDRSRTHGDLDFLVYADGAGGELDRITFAEHHRLASTFAHRLIDHYGVRPGDRVAIAMRNYPEWVIAFWGAAAAGAVLVPLNAWWSGEELHYGLADSGTTVLVADDQRLAAIAPHIDDLPDLRAVIVARSDGTPPVSADPFEDVIAGPRHDERPAVDIGPEDDATIFYTSGTTGRPKGALGTHRNICTNLISMLWGQARARARWDVPEPAPDPTKPSQNASLLTVPLFHATGCHSFLQGATAYGNKLVMLYKWDPTRALQVIEAERITTFGGVPAMVIQVIEHPDFHRYDTSSITSVGYGGAPAPPDLVRRIREAFGVEVSASNGYGLTETSSITTQNVGLDYVHKPDSVGPPIPVCDVKVVNEAGEELPRGSVGELWIKGPNVVKGYWRKPEATAAAFTDGWLHTGDIARIDDEGFVYIVDRAKDVVIRGGENVYSVQVEAVLFDHPDVLEAAVFGVPHRVLGEEVAAVVRLKEGSTLTAEDLAEWAGRHLARFEVPTIWDLRYEDLPRSPQGKVLKRVLRDELADRSSDPVPSG